MVRENIIEVTQTGDSTIKHTPQSSIADKAIKSGYLSARTKETVEMIQKAIEEIKNKNNENIILRFIYPWCNLPYYTYFV